MSSLDIQITEQLKMSQEEHSRSLATISANYEALNKLRTQLPVKFLTKTELKVHIANISKKNKAAYDRLQAELQKQKTQLEKLENDLKHENRETELAKLRKTYSNLESQFYQTAMELENYKKVILEATPERETYYYEDLVLFVANCKHEALDLWKHTMALSQAMETDLEYYSSRFFLDVADDYLREKGFAKVTEALRSNFLNAKDGVRVFRKVTNEALALEKAAKKLVDAFESDEVNFRKFAERKTSLGGF